MKKFKKIIAVAIVAILGVVGFAGCSATEEDLKNETKNVISETTGIVPVELSQDLAKSIYASAIQNTKLSEKYKLVLKSTTFAEGSILIGEDVIYAYYDNSNGYTNFRMNMVQNGSSGTDCYLTQFNNKYYVLDAKDNTYMEYDAEFGAGVSGGETPFMLLDLITGGMIYSDGNAFLTAVDGDSQIYVIIKDNLVIGYSLTSFDSNGLVEGIVKGTYTYGEFEANDFAGLPKSYEDMIDKFTLFVPDPD